MCGRFARSVSTGLTKGMHRFSQLGLPGSNVEQSWSVPASRCSGQSQPYFLRCSLKVHLDNDKETGRRKVSATVLRLMARLNGSLCTARLLITLVLDLRAEVEWPDIFLQGEGADNHDEAQIMVKPLALPPRQLDTGPCHH